MLVVSLVGINIIAINKNSKEETPTTTTKKVDNYISDITTDTVMIEGMEEIINVGTYHSNMGFTMVIEHLYYEPKIISDDCMEFIYTYNNAIKVRVEKLDKKYFDSSNKETTIDGIKATFNYFKDENKDLYFKVTLLVPDESEYCDAYVILNYMIERFNIV